MKVFFSYAREDEQQLDALIEQLAQLERDGIITTWHDREITAGENKKQETDFHLESADIILLLISPTFLASKYCYDIGLRALQRYKLGEARVIPIILRPSQWEHTPFYRLAPLPTNGKAITLWSNQDVVFSHVATELRNTIKKLRPPVQNHPTTPSPPQVPMVLQGLLPGPKSLTNNPNRRRFLQLLGLGGTGAFGAVVLAQLFKSQRPTPPKSLSKISFTSVRLGSSGQILERPVGSAMVFIEELAKGVSMTMVKIPEGKFTMGSPASEKNRESFESPEHRVTVPEFYCGQTLVTQAQWQSIMGNNPSQFTGNDKLPVDSVSWFDAKSFCQQLSLKTGRVYRLPSEAEWEYACRAGTKTPFAFGETITPEVVNYNGNSSYASAAKGKYRQKTTPVRSFPANSFGLYDTHGNLWEWCEDQWVENYNNSLTNGGVREDPHVSVNDSWHLLRGGSWGVLAEDCRSAFRHYHTPSGRGSNCGLRVVAVAFSTPSRQVF
jgi:formylglycine-generating enzyme required for sulfatase activity